MEAPMKIHDFGVPLFLEPPIQGTYLKVHPVCDIGLLENSSCGSGM